MQKPRLFGILPDNLFSDKFNTAKWTKLPTSNGSDPTKKFCAKLSLIDSMEIAKSCFGMVLVRLFEKDLSTTNFGNFLYLVG